MSELIDNNKTRREILKGLILDLHAGRPFDEVKSEFEEKFSGVSANEIAQMEQDLIIGGMPVESIQKLCDVHASVFKGSIEEIHAGKSGEMTPGHPAHTFMMENKKAAEILDEIRKKLDGSGNKPRIDDIKKLLEIDRHYSRKENFIFSFLEKHNILGPPKVMWAIDDEVRNELKAISRMLETDENADMENDLRQTLNKISEMIYKEDNILIPMAMETFTDEQWLEIKQGEGEIGYSFYQPAAAWKPMTNPSKGMDVEETGSFIKLDSGAMTRDEIGAILNTLPIDITFVGSDDKVKYFSEGSDRIFPRPRAIIGREVRNCHPPASVHIVEKLMEDLKNGKKDHEDFWIKSGGRFIYIRYFAVRDKDGSYLGTLEVTQDIKNIVSLEGEKRLAD
ncbi:MAG: DUF438 domain-containing protein [Clostridia bacterium]